MTILVADSWLVTDGRARALDAHRDRFLSGVAGRTTIPASDAAQFWQESIARIPRARSWFPRVQAVRSDGEADALQLLLRDPPPLGRGVVLATSRTDPRTVPDTKGPDIDALDALRRRVRLVGADEAVIVDDDGRIVDGSSTAIVWWVGDALVLPPASQTRVASVTSRTLSVLANALGTDVTEYAARPDELDQHEIWAVNALHGIRVVTGWVKGPRAAAEPGRLDLWRRRLDVLARPL